MKIAVFSGAGISRESGIDTFRDATDGLWMNHNVDEVATSYGWKKHPELVLSFHNMLRNSLHDKEPNYAHITLMELEKDHEVTIITQNVDNLHEKAGSTNILHLHGELFKSRRDEEYDGLEGTESDETVELFDCKGDLNIGDLSEDGVQLRMHTVLFGEMPYNINASYKAIMECDVLLVIGTSLNIGYTHHMLSMVNPDASIYYVDPSPSPDIDYLEPVYIKKGAVDGIKDFLELISEI